MINLEKYKSDAEIFGYFKCELKNVMLSKNMSRTRLSKLTNIKYDIINQVAYQIYKEDYEKIEKKKLRIHKIKILKNYLTGHQYKNKVTKALERLGYEQDQAASKFYEMFEDKSDIKEYN